MKNSTPRTKILGWIERWRNLDEAHCAQSSGLTKELEQQFPHIQKEGWGVSVIPRLDQKYSDCFYLVATKPDAPSPCIVVAIDKTEEDLYDTTRAAIKVALAKLEAKIGASYA